MMTQSSYVYDTSIIEEQRSVVKLLIGDEEWFMDFDEYQKAESEGRTKPVIFKDKLVLVDNETFEELQKLEGYLKNKWDI